MRISQWIGFVVFVAIISLTSVVLGDVKILKKDSVWVVSTSKYSVEIGKKGYLSSVKVGDQEFLSQSGKVPCGSYLCAGNIPLIKDLKKTGGNIISGKNTIASVSYKFSETEFEILLDNIQKKGCFYIIINKAVEKVNYTRGSGGVPTVSSSPVTAVCDQTRWLLPGASLDIAGCDKIWGPWKEHQVVAVRFASGRKRVVKFIPGDAKLGDIAPSKNTVTVASDFPKEVFTYSSVSIPDQIPLCMIGDSITWAGHGDYWRKYLLEMIPRLAFVGTHTACLGYSHAGEGGNGTSAVLARLRNIPECPYYSLLIGTNDNGVKKESQIKTRSKATAEKIEKIVNGLLDKKMTKKVFLCSVLPCDTANPLRDKTNAATNVILREKMKNVFPNEKIVWVEMENPIRAMKDWRPKIRLHPTLPGYKFIAKILADKIIETLKIENVAAKPVPKNGTGVKVWNLLDSKTLTTTVPVIAGWYTLSFTLEKKYGENAEVEVAGVGQSLPRPFNKKFKLSAKTGERVTLNFKTGYEGYGYTRSKLNVTPVNCDIRDVMLEKRRPSGKASRYGEGIFLDKTTKPALGELLEM
jgi:hypothetical protein